MGLGFRLSPEPLVAARGRETEQSRACYVAFTASTELGSFAAELARGI